MNTEKELILIQNYKTWVTLPDVVPLDQITKPKEKLTVPKWEGGSYSGITITGAMIKDYVLNSSPTIPGLVFDAELVNAIPDATLVLVYNHLVYRTDNTGGYSNYPAFIPMVGVDESYNTNRYAMGLYLIMQQFFHTAYNKQSVTIDPTIKWYARQYYLIHERLRYVINFILVNRPDDDFETNTELTIGSAVGTTENTLIGDVLFVYADLDLRLSSDLTDEEVINDWLDKL